MNSYKDRRSILIDKAFIFITLIFLWLPNSYSYLVTGTLYALGRWMQYGVAGIYIMFVFLCRKQNKLFWLNMFFSMVLIGSTIMNHANFNKCLNYVAPMMGTVAMITYYFGTGKEALLLKTMRQVLYIYLVINIITYYKYPNGLYTTELLAVRADKRNTFLGNRNSYKYYELLLIFVTYLEGLITRKQYTKKILIAFVFGIIGEMIGGSLTGTLIIVMIIIYYFLGERFLKISRINTKMLFFAALGIFIFVIGFVSLGKYTNIISILFNGNITFSNRVRIWMASIDVIKANPVLGIGTQSTTEIVTLIHNLHAHNQFLEVALRGGIVALSAYVYSIWCTLSIADKKNAFMNVCLFLAFVINMMEVETYSYAIISFFTAFIYCYSLKCNSEFSMDYGRL